MESPTSQLRSRSRPCLPWGASLAVTESLTDDGEDGEKETTAQSQSDVGDCTDHINTHRVDGNCDGVTIENSPFQMR